MPEQAPERRIPQNLARPSRTANVALDADDPVRCRHHDVEVVGDQQDAAAEFVTYPPDQVVERDLARVVDALHRLVEDQEVGFPRDRARQQHPLQFAARKVADRPPREMTRIDFPERVAHGRRVVPRRKPHQPVDIERQRRVDLEALRHISDRQARGPVDAPGIGRDQPEQRLGRCRLAAAVGPDQRDDLARADLEVDIAHDPAPAPEDAKSARGGQRRHPFGVGLGHGLDDRRHAASSGYLTEWIVIP